MKHFALILLLALPGFVAAQNGKIKYELKPGAGSSAESREITMFFSPTDYVYEMIKKNDYSALLQNNSPVLKKEAGLPKLPVQQWYGNLNNTVITYSTFDNNLKKYCVRDTIEVTKWELSNDTMTIKGLKCQKAYGFFSGQKYQAWFTPGIPVACAPLQFRGLPGLLIDVVNLSTGNTLTMLDIEWPISDKTATAIKIQPCAEGQTLSKQEFALIRNKQNARVSEIMDMIKKQQETQKEGGKSKLTLSDLNNKKN